MAASIDVPPALEHTAPAPAPDGSAAIHHPAATMQRVDPWTVAGEVGADGSLNPIDYNRLVDEFGTTAIGSELLRRFERVTGLKPHRFMRRNIVFSHRDFDAILDKVENNQDFYLYTGRGPSSSSMHIGHTQIFDLCKFLQDAFDVPLVIMLADDEKFLFDDRHSVEDVVRFSESNAKDIVAMGFDPAKTFMFSDYGFMGGEFYKNVTRFAKCTTFRQAKTILGLDEDANVGQIHFASVQGVSAFATSFPHIFGADAKKRSCLIPCAIDQDAYFQLAREIAPRMNAEKPAVIHSSFLPALQGSGTKMGAGHARSAIFLDDTADMIETKIRECTSPGRQEARDSDDGRQDRDPDQEVAYRYLRFFLEDDDELDRINVAYRKGEILAAELKDMCVRYVQEYISGFQARRARVTDEIVKDFMSPKPLHWGGNAKLGR